MTNPITQETLAGGVNRRAGRARMLAGRENRRGWGLALPTVIVLVILTGFPLLSVFTGALSPEGLQQFQILLNTPGFRQMLGNTVVWVLICVIGTIVIGYLAALALNHKRLKLAGLWRSLLLIPWITPAVVAATVWKWVYSRDYGILNSLLLGSGVIHEPVSWLTKPSVVLPALAMVQVWSAFPFVMLMISAGLQSVPDELYEAAQLDGANPVQVFRHVIVPAIRDITFIVGLIVIVWALNSFVPVWIITRGGPAGISTILPVQLYQAFQTGSAASVSVIALFQLVLSMGLAYLYVRQSRKADS